MRRGTRPRSWTSGGLSAVSSPISNLGPTIFSLFPPMGLRACLAARRTSPARSVAPRFMLTNDGGAWRGGDWRAALHWRIWHQVRSALLRNTSWTLSAQTLQLAGRFGYFVIA